MTFALEFQRYIQKTKKDAREVTAAACFQLAEKVITRTPVRTGRARGNWNANIGSTDFSTKDGATEADAITDARRAVDQFQLGDTFYLTNGLPYIRRLEYDAWSQQAKAGMVRITAEEFEQAVREALRNV